MSGRIARVDELERYPISGQDGLAWRPVRRQFGIKAFGINAYTAEEAGQRVVEEHSEDGGHEELYVVLRGRATFMVDGDELDAPAGTIVPAPRGPCAAPSPPSRGQPCSRSARSRARSSSRPAGSGSSPRVALLEQGDERARGGSSRLESRPIRARGGAVQPRVHRGAARRTATRPSNSSNARLELDREAVAKYAPSDEDFASIREDPRFLAITGQPDAVGASS